MLEEIHLRFVIINFDTMGILTTIVKDTITNPLVNNIIAIRSWKMT